MFPRGSKYLLRRYLDPVLPSKSHPHEVPGLRCWHVFSFFSFWVLFIFAGGSAKKQKVFCQPIPRVEILDLRVLKLEFRGASWDPRAVGASHLVPLLRSR